MSARANKSAIIRSILRNRRLTIDEIRERMEKRLKQIVSKQRLYALLNMMKDVEKSGRGGERLYEVRG